MCDHWSFYPRAKWTGDQADPWRRRWPAGATWMCFVPGIVEGVTLRIETRKIGTYRPQPATWFAPSLSASLFARRSVTFFSSCSFSRSSFSFSARRFSKRIRRLRDSSLRSWSSVNQQFNLIKMKHRCSLLQCYNIYQLCSSIVHALTPPNFPRFFLKANHLLWSISCTIFHKKIWS